MKDKDKIKARSGLKSILPIRIIMEYPRPSTIFMKSFSGFKGKELIGAEIGVQEGNNAKSILKNLPIKKLYLIDPYKGFEDWGGVYSQKWMDKIKRKAHKKLREYEDKIIWIEKTSDEALSDIPELDFVYIDGNHELEFVSKDMRNYYNKVKKGGVISGHDIVHEEIRLAFINELQLKHNLFPYVGRDDWWVVKS